MASATGSTEDIENESKPLLPTEERSRQNESGSLGRKLFIGLMIALPSVAPGMSLGYSGITLDQFALLDIAEKSWFASLTAVGIAVGCLLSCPIMERFGRRMTLLLVSIISLVGWLVLYIQPSTLQVEKLYAGRFLTGVSAGLAVLPASVYASECLTINSRELRIDLAILTPVALSTGVLFVYVMGTSLAYYKIAALAGLISIFAFVMVAIFVPESPSWLLSKGRAGDAEWAKKELNIKETDPSPSTSSEGASEQSRSASSAVLSFKESVKELKKPEVYKPLTIMVIFFLFQQFAGIHVLMAFTIDIIRRAGITILTSYFVAIVTATLMVITTVCACFIYANTSVRLIATLSGIGMTISMLIIGIYITIQKYWPLSINLYFMNVFPLLALLAYVTSSSLGFLVLPWAMLNNVFPSNVKNFASSLSLTVGYIFSYIAIKVYLYLVVGLGNIGIFFFYGIMSLIGSLYVMQFLPETKGKTLEEILSKWMKKPTEEKQENK